MRYMFLANRIVLNPQRVESKMRIIIMKDAPIFALFASMDLRSAFIKNITSVHKKNPVELIFSCNKDSNSRWKQRKKKS